MYHKISFNRVWIVVFLITVPLFCILPVHSQENVSEHIERGIKFFRDRFNVRDIEGLLNEASTAGQNHPPAVIDSLVMTLREIFHRIPPNVHMFFNLSNVNVNGNNATLDLEYYFRIKTPTPESMVFENIQGTINNLSLHNPAGRWRVGHLRRFIREIYNAIP